ncbi:DUF92 domain-containing protein [Halobacteriales archaeon QH_10_65_19]|nr:MAG: DUF92 domain-containing protein [Halobacteriales archaeon QH_10_65_19]
MTTAVRRAVAFAAVASLALVAPLLVTIEEPAVATVAAIGPFLLIAAFALSVSDSHVLFELFARPGDRRDGTLYGLAGFSLAAAGVAILSVGFGMPPHVYVGTIVLVALGNLAAQVVRTISLETVVTTAGFVAGGALAAAVAQLVAVELSGAAVTLPEIVFLATSGGLLAALLREMLFKRDDALVMVTVGLVLWLFASLPVEITATRIGVALAVTGLLTIVLGDFGWFLMLGAFFGIGGLSSKYRYEIKRERGIAEENEGARGTGNVLANSLVALVAVLGAAASSHEFFMELGVSEGVFFYAFAGAVGAALADTLSSEIGGLFDNPRLVTNFEVVDPGTDGAVTWQGELAGIAGAAVVAGIALVAFDAVAPLGAACIVAASVVGMTVDSVLGATIEGRLTGNQGVNFLATLAAAGVGVVFATVIGLSI